MNYLAIATLAPTFRWLWYGWGLLFIIIEGMALYLRKYYPDSDRTGGTLSELVWRNIRKYNNHRHTIAFFLVLISWLILSYHFFIQ